MPRWLLNLILNPRSLTQGYCWWCDKWSRGKTKFWGHPAHAHLRLQYCIKYILTHHRLHCPGKADWCSGWVETKQCIGFLTWIISMRSSDLLSCCAFKANIKVEITEKQNNFKEKKKNKNLIPIQNPIDKREREGEKSLLTSPYRKLSRDFCLWSNERALFTRLLTNTPVRGNPSFTSQLVCSYKPQHNHFLV